MIGTNPTVNHPVAATCIKNAAKRGTKIVLVADPHRTDIGGMHSATCSSGPTPTWRLLNALIHEMIDEGLADEEFVASRTSNYEALKANVQSLTAEAMAPICGIHGRRRIREVARTFATRRGRR